MAPDQLILLELLGAAYGLTAAIYYLTYAVSTLAVVGLVGYYFALRAAKEKK